MAEAQGQGERLCAGELATAEIERLLGLEDGSEEARVRLVAWYDDHVLALVGPKGAPTLVVVISEAKPDAPAWVRTEYLAITYKGSGAVSPEVDEKVRVKAPHRLGTLSVFDLLAIIKHDPGTKPLPQIKTSGQEVTNLLTSWAGQDAYAEFFAVGEIQRSQLDSIDLSGAFRFVQHCELECLMQSPHGIAPLVSLVEYPWDNRTRNFDLGWAEMEAPGAPEADGMITTEMTESDVVFGNPKKLRQVLDTVVSAPNPSGKIIFFSNTCVPMVIGEDVESLVRQYARKSNVPLVYLTVTPKSMYNVFRDLLYTKRRAAEESAGPADPHAVNLIGFPDGPLTKELHDLLALAGITVNTHLIPDFSVARIEALPRAALSVFYPNRIWANHYAHLTEDTRIRCIFPKAPYGFLGTKAWLDAVCQALGLGDKGIEAYEKAAQPLEDRWAKLRSEAAKHGVCIVLRAEESANLTDPSYTWGVPVLAFLQEAGFRVEVLIKAYDREQARKAALEVKEAAPDARALSIKAFNSFDSMRKRLRDSDADAVLSYHTFDWRITEAGKNRFSLQIFEMGLSGAIRSVERLIGICRTPFYRLYSRFLARSEDGMRSL